MPGSPRFTPPPNHVNVGRIVGSHGVKGGMKIELLTDFPQRFSPGNFLFIGQEKFEIKKVTWHKTQARVILKGIDRIERVEELKWVYVTVPESDLPELDDDEFMADDLVGCEVISEKGESYGHVTDVLRYPAQDILVVGEIMIPAVAEFIQDIDLDKNQIVAKLIPGMAKPDEAEVVE